MNDGIDEWMSGQRGKGRDIHNDRLHTRQGKGQKDERPRSINCFSSSPNSTELRTVTNSVKYSASQIKVWG